MTRGRNNRTGALAACAVAGALVLAACGTSGAGKPSGQDLSARDIALLTRSGTQPLDEARLFHAETELVAACMTAQGFRYRVDAFSPATGTYEERQIGMAARRTEGYGLYRKYARGKAAQGDSAPAGQQRKAGGAGLTNDQYVARLSGSKADAYMRALRGDGTGLREIRFAADSTVTFPGTGCEADSRRKLFGTLDDWAAATYLPQTLNASLTDRVSRDARYVAALRAWKTCMADKGYSYGTPEEARDRLGDAYRGGGATRELRRREVAVAVADGECAERLRLPSTALALRKRYAASLPATDRSRLRKVTAIWTLAVARARELSPAVRSDR